MGFKLNYDELQKFCKSFDGLRSDYETFLKDFLTREVNRVIAETKKKTPVGTPESTGIKNYIGGTLRRGWEIGRIEFLGNRIQARILNNTEYATEVEYGHRIMGGSNHDVEVGWKEGNFMLTTSIDYVQSRLPQRYQKGFEDFCKSHGVIE